MEKGSEDDRRLVREKALLDDFVKDTEERLRLIKKGLNSELDKVIFAEVHKHFRVIKGLSDHLGLKPMFDISKAAVRLLELISEGEVNFDDRLVGLYQDVVTFLQLKIKELRFGVILAGYQQYLYLLNRIQAVIIIKDI